MILVPNSRARLFDDGPEVVAGVAGLVEQRDPAVRIIMEFGRQHPAFEDLLLPGRAIAVDLHEGAPARYTLDLLHYLDRARTRKIMHGVEAQHAIEAAVGKWKPFRRSQMQAADHVRFAVHQGIERDVEPENFQSGTGRHQVLDQKALGTADVENAHAGPQAKMRDDVARHRNPAAIVAVAAIAVVAGSVEIHFAVLPGDGDNRGILGVLAQLDVSLHLRQRPQQIDFAHGADFTLAGPPATPRPRV